MIYLLSKWHAILNMPKYDEEWHENDIADEYTEYREAVCFMAKWSELSDIVYTYTRAQWSGYTNIPFPLNRALLYIGVLYMFPKYTLRWLFFRILGRRLATTVPIREVRNPAKTEKMHVIAKRYNLDPDLFTQEARKLKRWWILLK